MIASLLSRIGIEVWKDIPNFEGRYQVSNLGNVRSLNFKGLGYCKNLSNSLDAKGYHIQRLSKNKKSKTYSMHKLIAITFLNHKPNGYKLVVDHIDGNSSNNKLYNLQLTTQRHNTSKDRKGGTSKYVGVSWLKQRNKWDARIQINGKIKFIGYFTDEKEAAQAYQNELKKINESKETHTDTTHT